MQLIQFSLFVDLSVFETFDDSNFISIQDAEDVIENVLLFCPKM